MKNLLLLFAGLWSAAAAGQKPRTQTLQITLTTQGNEIAFDQTTLRVRAGQRIRLRFVNAAKVGSAIHHDLAILKPGTLDTVLKLLQKEGYRLEKLSQNPSILALSRTLEPGEDEVLDLDPLSPGSYPFVCLMAGHGDLLGMQGTLIVSP